MAPFIFVLRLIRPSSRIMDPSFVLGEPKTTFPNVIIDPEVVIIADSFQNLDVYKLSMQFAYDVYQIVSSFPDFEKFGLSSQLRRASVSVPSNIAEGSGRQHQKEFVQFLFLSKGSLREVMTQLELSKMLGYISEETFIQMQGQADRLHKMLNRLIARLKNPGG